MGVVFRTRTGVAAIAAVLVVGATLGAAVAVAHFTGGKSAVPAGAVPGVLQTPGSGACVTKEQARQVWNDVASRLDALVLHPSLDAVDTVASGAAATQMREYVQQRLLDQNLSEREQSRLDDLTVVQAACGSQPLTVRVTATLVQDDYLDSAGTVDHSDPGVGQTSHLLESYVRVKGGWKLITIVSLDQSPAPGSTV